MRGLQPWGPRQHSVPGLCFLSLGSNGLAQMLPKGPHSLDHPGTQEIPRVMCGEALRVWQGLPVRPLPFACTILSD